jgi:predicted MFS family arabinose efflux permease
MAIVALSLGRFGPAMLGALLWGLGSFSSNSVQQSRLVAAMPPLAAATVALNTSAVYLGQSLGSAAGGAVVVQGISPWLSWLSAAFLALAAATSVFASRLATQRPVNAP